MMCPSRFYVLIWLGIVMQTRSIFLAVSGTCLWNTIPGIIKVSLYNQFETE